jgi:hypothetical protein
LAKPGRKIQGEEPKRNRFTILFTDSELEGLNTLAEESMPPTSITFLVRAALEEKYKKIFKPTK